MPAKAKNPDNQWFIYLLECENSRIYTGIAVDPEARFAKHRSGKGAKFTQRNKPARLLGSLKCADRSEASRLEAAVKKLSPAHKRALAIKWSEAKTD